MDSKIEVHNDDEVTLDFSIHSTEFMDILTWCKISVIASE
jgi:hypothetical protein